MPFEVTATRKRPASFDTLVGQEFVVSTLKNALANGRIAHAYLFSGPRGVGKTSSARLLAKALNCQNGPTPKPCGECGNCLSIARGTNVDVIEIDGASNTSVADIRAIKEEVMFPPTSCRYKIYIIDEVHMLSTSAFNALLKTIEEPPEYIIFIFATTELQKVPATIRSRCQQFGFRLLSYETIKKQLREASDESGILADDDALFWIAKESTGSMRDAYTLFDQVASFSDGHITMEKIRDKLGIIGTERLGNIIADIVADKQSSAILRLHSLILDGVSVDSAIRDFAEYFRSLLLIKKRITSTELLGESAGAYPAEIVDAFTEMQLNKALEMFLNLYRDVRYSLNPQFELECAVSRLGALKYEADNATVIEQIARLKNDLISGRITPLNKRLEDIPTVKPANTAALVPDLEEQYAERPSMGPKSTGEDRPAADRKPDSNTIDNVRQYDNNSAQRSTTSTTGTLPNAHPNENGRAFAGAVHSGAGNEGWSESRQAAATLGLRQAPISSAAPNSTAALNSSAATNSSAASNFTTELEARSVPRFAAPLGRSSAQGSQAGSDAAATPYRDMRIMQVPIVNAPVVPEKNSIIPTFNGKEFPERTPVDASGGLPPERSSVEGPYRGSIPAGNAAAGDAPMDNEDGTPVLYSRERLKEVLPQGVCNVVETPHGIELQFNSTFLYNAAVNNQARILENIRQAIGPVSVSFSFSQELADKRLEEEKKRFVLRQETELHSKGNAMGNVSELDASDRNTFNDFLSMFKGKEKK